MTRKKRRPMGQTIGGMVVGFDYQVFRATKPPTELVESAKPIAPIPASDGGSIEIEPPMDVGDPEPPASGPE